MSKSFAARLLLCTLLVSVVSAHAQQQSAAPAGSASSSSQPQACVPPASGKPCEAGAGNPINLITGNKYQQEVDMPALPGVLGLEIVRHYNSVTSGHTMANGIVGRGWKLSYETDLYAIGNSVQIITADGARIIFARDPLNPNLCSTSDPANGTIQITKTERGDEYFWSKTNGQKLSFNSLGKLTQIAAPTGEFVTLQHDAAGMLVQVTDPQGRKLRLTYLDRKAAQANDRFSGVQTIDSPVGRYTYEYGSALPPGATLARVHVLANLVKVTMPTRYDTDKKAHAYTERGTTSSSISRLYHYEDARHPTLLTGISVSGSGSDGKLMIQRISTFGYNVDGKGILTTYANDVNKVTLEYPEGGKTVLTNSLGQKTVYRHGIVGGEFRILEARGPGCALCAPTNVRYGYDKFGRKTEVTQLSAAGQPIQTTRSELDYYGRVLKLSTINYANGKAGKPQWQVRYEYAESTVQAPTLIARPSVVPGKESVTKIAYNKTNQPVTVTESGWSPGLDGKSQANVIERTTMYNYDSAGRRIEVDGPLANAKVKPGPDNSDITRTAFDSKTGLPIRTSAPGGIVTEVIERDDALRPTLMRNNDGVRTIETRAIYTYSGQLLALTQRAAFSKDAQVDTTLTRTTRFAYNAAGKLTSVTGPDQTTLRTEYDSAGRPIALIDPKGNRITSRFDGEGKLIAVVTQDAQGQILNGMLNLWDEQNNLRARLTPIGLDMAQSATPIAGEAIRIDGTGQVSASASHAGHTDILAPDNSTRQLIIGRPGMIMTDGANRIHAALKDDFGRVVLEVSPDEGRLTYRFGETSFEKQHTAKDGKSSVTERLEFAVSGRLVKRTIAGCAETLMYEGDLLARIDGCGNSHAYRRDAFGQIVQHTQSIQPDDSKAAVISFTLSYTYDPVTGRLIERRLPDGQRLSYRYDATDGKQTIVVRDSGWLAWVDRAIGQGTAGALRTVFPRKMTEQALVTDIAWRPFDGMTAVTAHNGVRNQTAFDRAGRMIAQEVGTASNPTSIEALRYGYDGANNIVSSSRNAEQTNYRYDAMHRLATEQSGTLATAAPTQSITAQTQASQVAQSAKQTATTPVVAKSATFPANEARYAYNTLGQRMSPSTNMERDSYGRQSGRGNQRYTYDDAHRLIEVTEKDKAVARYRYDVLGNRIAKTVNGKTTYFIYDTGHKLIAEANEAGKPTTQYLYSDHRPYAVMQAKGNAQARTLFAVHADHRGLPLAVTDDRQRIVWQGDFDAFANERTPAKSQVAVNDNTFSLISAAHAANDSGFEMNLRLAGQYEDKETGLYYNVHRYYDPKQGRYITPDPIGLAGGEDRYSYVNSNPMAGTDPLGLFHIPGWSFAGLNPLNEFNGIPIVDGGHGDIVRIAFAQYQQMPGNSGRFSNQFIDWVVRNNYHSDVNGSTTCYPLPFTLGGGQCSFKNHFDNPNDGPMYKDAAATERKDSYKDGKNDDWIQESLNQFNSNRNYYLKPTFAPEVWGADISFVLSTFGQNMHALADFYAHTNWVDDAARGGCVKNTALGGLVKEDGYVPTGLGKTTLWNEQSNSMLFSGTVAGMNAFCPTPQMGDLSCISDKTTHGYWNKDGADTDAGKQAYNGPVKIGWRAEKYSGTPPKDEKGQNLPYGTGWYSPNYSNPVLIGTDELIFVSYNITNKHQLAFNLAVEHTKLEIAKLYEGAAGVTANGQKLTDIFKMSKDAMNTNKIVYDTNFSKN